MFFFMYYFLKLHIISLVYEGGVIIKSDKQAYFNNHPLSPTNKKTRYNMVLVEPSFIQRLNHYLMD